ncbi:MAG TPA: hypothetical protein VK163_07415, partial [Opitutaceae bacterium]|nr:hypothetical protein [Opitutaceae bacterium]
MRIVLKLLLGLALAGALLLATVPWWLGLALAPLARGQGVVFARYERVGYGRFRLHEVRREDAASVFSATVIEADTPLLWAWQVWRGRESAVAIENWSLVLQQPATSAEQPAPPVNVSTVHGEVVDALTLVGRWLPRAEARRGEVRLPGGAPIGVAAVSWRDGALTVSGGRVHGRELELSLAREAADVLTLRVNSVADAASVRLEWAGEELRGALAWHGQPASLHARFPAQGWIPAEAELRTERWSFPAELLGLQKQYVTIEGGGILRWREGRGTLTGDWRAVPRGNAPAMQVQFAAVGDRAAITVERLRVDAPFAEATLSAPVTIGLVGAVEVPSARLAFRADLGRQTWFDAQGRLEGELAVRERSGLAVQEFRFAGEGLRLAGLEVARASLRGALRWPELTLEQGELVLDSQSEIAVSGSLDLDRRTLADTRVTAKLGETWFRRWLPPELRWSAASIEA